MLNLNKPLIISRYLKKPSGTRLIREKSNISQPREGIEDISSKEKKKSLDLKLKKSYTLEFHLENKKMTLKDNLNTSKINTQTIPPLQTLDQVSTSKDRGLRGFWRESLKVTSKKLWFPTETALAGLDTLYLNGFSNNTTQNSYVIKNQIRQNNKNCQMTLWPSSLFSQTNTMIKENTKINYCRKIRFYPSHKHKMLLEKCFGATRYLINKALEEIKNGKIQKITNAIELRNHLKYQDKHLKKEELWLKDIPYDTRDGAIRQLCSNFKTAFTQMKNKTIKTFKMRFKSRRNPKQVCFLNKKAFNPHKNTLFIRRIKDKIKVKETIPKGFGAPTIVREKNKYYFCFPYKKDILDVKKPYNIISLDPGVRTFQTLYSPDGLVGKIGNNSILEYKKIYEKEDVLKGVLDTLKLRKRTRYNIKKRCFLLRTKVKNKVKDLHRKSCSWITSNFKNIFLPSFNVKDMIKRSNRVIRKSTVRSMLSLSHFSFKERLLHMAKSRGCQVYICDESWTSKTCGCCGYIKDDLGGSKVYECLKCNSIIDRDYNGARNIYLKKFLPRV